MRVAVRLFVASLAAVAMAGCDSGTRRERPAAGSGSVGSTPNGTIAFARWDGDVAGVWMMHADGSRQRRLAPKRDAWAWGGFVWSPDGKQFAFTATAKGVGEERSFEHGELFVMSADGSGLRRLTWTRHAGGQNFNVAADWFPDGRRILFDRNDDGPAGIYVINADASGERRLTKARWGPRDPSLSPDARTIAYIDDDDVYLMNADGSGRRRLARMPPAWFPQLAWSPDGRKIAVLDREVWLMNTDGSGLRAIIRSLRLSGFAWAPDGRRFAVALREQPRGDFQIWVVNAEGGGKRKLTSAPGGNESPAWSPDGAWIAFTSNRDGNAEIYVMRADGSGQRRLTHNESDDVAPVWSPTK